MRNREYPLHRSHIARRFVIRAVVPLFQTVGTAAVLVAGLCGLFWVGFHAGSPTLPDQPGSGIIVRTEATAVWIPRALLDLARCKCKARPAVIRSPGELRTYLEHRGMNAAWYALVYRGYQVNGESAEITQVHRMSEAPAHMEEFQDVLAAAAGNGLRYGSRDFSHVMVGIIPDTLQAADPLEAVTKLLGQRGAEKERGDSP
jgi:hypothetical protein